MYKKEVNMLKL